MTISSGTRASYNLRLFLNSIGMNGSMSKISTDSHGQALFRPVETVLLFIR